MDMLADVDLNFEDAKGARNWFLGACTRAKLTGSLSSGASSICRCVYNARDSGNSSRAVLFNVNNNGTLTVPSFFKTFELKPLVTNTCQNTHSNPFEATETTIRTIHQQ
ncbi:hypothetical protein IMY05_010G0016900 [Salix suchowensis]|nr:hypothetical protein IMY05_010G0016900 [Salix suchowensis]